MTIQEKFKENVLAKIKAMVLRHGDNAYELCDPDSPQEGIRVELPAPGGLTDVWLITNVGPWAFDAGWYAGITLEADPMTTDATPLDNLPEPVLQQIYSRMLDLEFDEEIAGEDHSYHLLTVYGGIEPSLGTPMSEPKGVLRQARENYRTNGDDNLLICLDINWETHTVEAYTYSRETLEDGSDEG